MVWAQRAHPSSPKSLPGQVPSSQAKTGQGRREEVGISDSKRFSTRCFSLLVGNAVQLQDCKIHAWDFFLNSNSGSPIVSWPEGHAEITKDHLFS